MTVSSKWLEKLHQIAIPNFEKFHLQNLFGLNNLGKKGLKYDYNLSFAPD